MNKPERYTAVNKYHFVRNEIHTANEEEEDNWRKKKKVQVEVNRSKEKVFRRIKLVDDRRVTFSVPQSGGFISDNNRVCASILNTFYDPRCEPWTRNERKKKILLVKIVYSMLICINWFLILKIEEKFALHLRIWLRVTVWVCVLLPQIEHHWNDWKSDRKRFNLTAHCFYWDILSGRKRKFCVNLETILICHSDHLNLIICATSWSIDSTV